jgi:hypothetical protein
MKVDDYCVNFLLWSTGSARACKIRIIIKYILKKSSPALCSHLLRQMLAAQNTNLHMRFGIV